MTSAVEGGPATGPFYYFLPQPLISYVFIIILLLLCHLLYKHLCFVTASTFEQLFIL